MIEEGILTQNEVEDITKKQFDYYNEELQSVDKYQPEKSYFNKQWAGFSQAPSDLTVWDTGVEWDLLSYIGRKSVYHPENFVRSFFVNLFCRIFSQLFLFSIPQAVHPHIKKTFVNGRIKKLAEGSAIDWATGEALAFGSLMYQGHNVSAWS